MIEDLRLKIERYKILCEELEKDCSQIFIKFFERNLERWSSADILSVGENNLYIQPFKGKENIGQKLQIPWANIIEIEKFKVRE